MTIHVALIEHRRNGDFVYAAEDTDLLDRQVAAFCRGDWPTDYPEHPTPPKSDCECIAAYFEYTVEIERAYLQQWETTVATPENIRDLLARD